MAAQRAYPPPFVFWAAVIPLDLESDGEKGQSAGGYFLAEIDLGNLDHWRSSFLFHHWWSLNWTFDDKIFGSSSKKSCLLS